MPEARRSPISGLRRVVPHYRQTTDFTCGPSSCLMAMKALDGRKPMSRSEELAIWREATTIFMGPAGGHGGCGALGLALALHRRGFRPEVHVNHRGVLLAKRSRLAERREAMGLVQERDLAEARARGIPVRYDRLSIGDLEAAAEAGHPDRPLQHPLYPRRQRPPLDRRHRLRRGHDPHQ